VRLLARRPRRHTRTWESERFQTWEREASQRKNYRKKRAGRKKVWTKFSDEEIARFEAAKEREAERVREFKEMEVELQKQRARMQREYLKRKKEADRKRAAELSLVKRRKKEQRRMSPGKRAEQRCQEELRASKEAAKKGEEYFPGVSSALHASVGCGC